MVENGHFQHFLPLGDRMWHLKRNIFLMNLVFWLYTCFGGKDSFADSLKTGKKGGNGHFQHFLPLEDWMLNLVRKSFLVKSCVLVIYMFWCEKSFTKRSSGLLNGCETVFGFRNGAGAGAPEKVINPFWVANKFFNAKILIIFEPLLKNLK